MRMVWYQYQENTLTEDRLLSILDRWLVLLMEGSTGIGMEVKIIITLFITVRFYVSVTIKSIKTNLIGEQKKGI